MQLLHRSSEESGDLCLNSLGSAEVGGMASSPDAFATVTSFFRPPNGRSEILVSVPERALLALLSDVVKTQSLAETRQLVESLSRKLLNLRKLKVAPCGPLHSPI